MVDPRAGRRGAILATVVAGLPNDHYHAFVDPIVDVLLALAIAAVLPSTISVAALRAPDGSGRAVIGAVAAVILIVAPELVGSPQATAWDGGWPAAERSALRHRRPGEWPTDPAGEPAEPQERRRRGLPAHARGRAADPQVARRRPRDRAGHLATHASPSSSRAARATPRYPRSLGGIRLQGPSGYRARPLHRLAATDHRGLHAGLTARARSAMHRMRATTNGRPGIGPPPTIRAPGAGDGGGAATTTVSARPVRHSMQRVHGDRRSRSRKRGGRQLSTAVGQRGRSAA